METKDEIILSVQYVATRIAERSHHFNYFHINSSFLFTFEMLKPALALELLLIDERS
jgi:hypothetical protein